MDMREQVGKLRPTGSSTLAIKKTFTQVGHSFSPGEWVALNFLGELVLASAFENYASTLGVVVDTTADTVTVCTAGHVKQLPYNSSDAGTEYQAGATYYLSDLEDGKIATGTVNHTKCFVAYGDAEGVVAIEAPEETGAIKTGLTGTFQVGDVIMYSPLSGGSSGAILATNDYAYWGYDFGKYHDLDHMGVIARSSDISGSQTVIVVQSGPFSFDSTLTQYPMSKRGKYYVSTTEPGKLVHESDYVPDTGSYGRIKVLESIAGYCWMNPEKSDEHTLRDLWDCTFPGAPVDGTVVTVSANRFVLTTPSTSGNGLTAIMGPAVLGVSTATSAIPGAIQAATNNRLFLRNNAGTLVFGQITSDSFIQPNVITGTSIASGGIYRANIANNAVSYEQLAKAFPWTVVANPTSTIADVTGMSANGQNQVLHKNTSTLAWTSQLVLGTTAGGSGGSIIVNVDSDRSLSYGTTGNGGGLRIQQDATAYTTVAATSGSIIYVASDTYITVSSTDATLKIQFPSGNKVTLKGSDIPSTNQDIKLQDVAVCGSSGMNLFYQTFLCGTPRSP